MKLVNHQQRPAEKTIALLGQPNAGKSTLFNALTGSRQHVGNWPGKTVEQKYGSFVHNKTEYTLVDLPGSYSLYAHSQEEMITREYIASGQADLVCILIDASQLQRSLFMLADYAGIGCPVILIVNMLDIAAARGRHIDLEKIGQRLGVAVVGMSATDKGTYADFFSALEQGGSLPDCNELEKHYQLRGGKSWQAIWEQLPEKGIGVYARFWLGAKLLEKDEGAVALVRNALPAKKWQNINAVLESEPEGALCIGQARFAWIEELVQGAVKDRKPAHSSSRLSRFDRLAISRRWGRVLTVGVLLCGLIASFLITVPLMYIAFTLPRTLFPKLLPWLVEIGMDASLISLLETCANACGTVLGMTGFVGGSFFVFSLLEDVGYMARVSYVFDNAMTRIGLQGKCIMPFVMSFGCSIGGSVGSRVIDSWGQRMLTIALAWFMPCAATWGVITVFGTAFFGMGTIWVLCALFFTSFLLLIITAKIFAPKLVPASRQCGLIMELPPYHPPKWGSIFRLVFSRMGGFIKRAFIYIVSFNILFWVLAYSADGNVQSSLLYRFGTMIEPVTIWFGLRWQTFIAYLCSMMAKESALGVLSSVFGGVASTVVGRGAVSANLGTQMTSQLSKPEVIAFLFAFYFNIPCFVAVLSAKEESHSWKWTGIIVGYYICMALIMAAVSYRVALLIW
ncbi:MAG: ferrous iron transport protein B [Acidobacteria bacterium]|nr:MAG: ferrous iron transport protein B [Acidobacteriota bacterium]